MYYKTKSIGVLLTTLTLNSVDRLGFYMESEKTFCLTSLRKNSPASTSGEMNCALFGTPFMGML
jgi:hypothetical protein